MTSVSLSTKRVIPLLKLINHSVLLCLLLIPFVQAQPVPDIAIPAPPELAASAYILQDFHSGHVIARKAENEQVEPASITKVMTAYVVFDAIRNNTIGLQDQVLVSEKAWRMGGSKMFIEVGKQVSVDDLLKGLIVQSGNDAAVALAEHVAGSESAFVSYMNQYAQQLGMTGSSFMNTTGWPAEGHFMTTHDIARLVRAMIRNFPEWYENYYSMRSFTFNEITQSNRNTLLFRDDSVDGVKTGHTEAAGYCLASSAQRDGMRLIAIVMGTDSNNARTRQSQSLLNYGFRFYETNTLYSQGDALQSVRLWNGVTDNVAVGLAQDMTITIPRGAYDKLQASMDIQGNIEAPIAQGDEIGRVQVRLQDQVVAEQPLIVLQDVTEGGFFKKLQDRVLKMLE